MIDNIGSGFHRTCCLLTPEVCLLLQYWCSSWCICSDTHGGVHTVVLIHHRQIPAWIYTWQHAWKSQEPTNRADENELQCPKYTRARIPDVIFFCLNSASPLKAFPSISEPACAIFWADTKPAEDLISHCNLQKKTNQTKPNPTTATTNQPTHILSFTGNRSIFSTWYPAWWRTCPSTLPY